MPIPSEKGAAMMEDVGQGEGRRQRGEDGDRERDGRDPQFERC